MRSIELYKKSSPTPLAGKLTLMSPGLHSSEAVKDLQMNLAQSNNPVPFYFSFPLSKNTSSFNY